MPNEIHPIALPDAFLTALGRMMVNWSQLEGILDFVLIKLMGASVNDIRFHIPFAQMTFQAKMECLKSITDSLQDAPGNEDAHARFKKVILPKLNGLQTHRNQITHCKWALRGTRITRGRLKAKGKVEITENTVTLLEIEKMAADILETSGNLWAMVAFPEFNQPGPA